MIQIIIVLTHAVVGAVFYGLGRIHGMLEARDILEGKEE